MQLSPVIVKKYVLNEPQSAFLQKLRNKTREPYFDNKNKRRLDIEDNKCTIYADEYDNMISLRNEVINRRWMVFKTIVFLKIGGDKKYFWTISYPGHVATFMMLFSTFAIFYGLNGVLASGDYRLFLISILLYASIIYLSKDDYKSHHLMIKNCVNIEGCVEE